MRISDWSSDVCSTDEHGQRPVAAKAVLEALAALHHVRLVDEALQLGQVGRRQRLVVLQLGDGHVVLAGADEGLDLALVLGKVDAGAEVLQDRKSTRLNSSH